MTDKPNPDQVTDSDDVVVKFTVDQIRESLNVLHFGSCALVVSAFRLSKANPRYFIAVGSLFTFSSHERPTVTLDAPRCILGREPSWPARIAGTLTTTPAGEVCLWSANEVALQKLILHVPQVVPWIPAAMDYSLVNRRAY